MEAGWGQHAQIDAQGDQLKAVIREQVVIETQYPSATMPSNVRARYASLRNEQDALAVGLF